MSLNLARLIEFLIMSLLLKRLGAFLSTDWQYHPQSLKKDFSLNISRGRFLLILTCCFLESYTFIGSSILKGVISYWGVEIIIIKLINMRRRDDDKPICR